MDYNKEYVIGKLTSFTVSANEHRKYHKVYNLPMTAGLLAWLDLDIDWGVGCPSTGRASVSIDSKVGA